ncbi:MAG: hypothetical protein ACK5SX_13690 [Sandaracinobacter sp.]
MRAGLAHANGRIVRALQARLGLACGAASVPAFLLGQGAGTVGPGSRPLVVIEALHEDPWASLTFSGIRHRVDLRLDGGAQAIDEAMVTLASWPDEAGPLPGGHFLAEVQVTETAREVGEGGRMILCLRLDALTIEE